MPLCFKPDGTPRWTVRKIAVIGPGIVGTPMAAMLAHAQVRIGTDRPARVTVVQRASATSGWKVAAINAGRSPIGGVEPELDRIVADAAAAGLLNASHDIGQVADADVILVCVQTDRDGTNPDYGPLLDALHGVARALLARPGGNLPLIVIESTLAPSSMTTVVQELFAGHGLVEGRDILLANSPNRVMPGRLVERVRRSDKLVAGLDPRTPSLVAALYRHVVTEGTVHQTSSLTAEIVKTLENAYRDVRIAYSAELCRWCDDNEVDFFALREAVNARLQQRDAASANPGAVPSGALLVPTIGVGGHCLPKDGVLLRWRRQQQGHDDRRSLILQARHINDASPGAALDRIEHVFGAVKGRKVALLGVAYRFDSEDTRNSPTLALAQQLLARDALIWLHDPYVRPHDQNLQRTGLGTFFTPEAGEAVWDADLLVFCVAHQDYLTGLEALLDLAPDARGVFDGANLFRRERIERHGMSYAGIGRGWRAPAPGLVEFAAEGFGALERGVANELHSTIKFLNARYAGTAFSAASLEEVRRLAATCVTGCEIAEAGPVFVPAPYEGFLPVLVRVAGRRKVSNERGAHGFERARTTQQSAPPGSVAG